MKYPPFSQIWLSIEILKFWPGIEHVLNKSLASTRKDCNRFSQNHGKWKYVSFMKHIQCDNGWSLKSTLQLQLCRCQQHCIHCGCTAMLLLFKVRFTLSSIRNWNESSLWLLMPWGQTHMRSNQGQTRLISEYECLMNQIIIYWRLKLPMKYRKIIITLWHWTYSNPHYDKFISTLSITTLSPEQNGYHFTETIFECIF